MKNVKFDHALGFYMLRKVFSNNFKKNVGFQECSDAAWNLGLQLTQFQPGGADYAYHITACPPRFENLRASLPCNGIMSVPSISLEVL